MSTGSTSWVSRTSFNHRLCGTEKALAGGSSVCYNAPDLARGGPLQIGTLQIVLVFVFVVAVAFGAWFFNYGLSLLRDQSSETDLEPQVPDAQREAA